MALVGALCSTLLAATGFANKHPCVGLAGLIQRLPHSNRYQLTFQGIRIAVFYTKAHNRLLIYRPGTPGAAA